MTTLTQPQITYYLVCTKDSCQHLYESDRTDTLCPICLSAGKVYGIQVNNRPNQES